MRKLEIPWHFHSRHQLGKQLSNPPKLLAYGWRLDPKELSDLTSSKSSDTNQFNDASMRPFTSAGQLDGATSEDRI